MDSEISVGASLRSPACITACVVTGILLVATAVGLSLQQPWWLWVGAGTLLGAAASTGLLISAWRGRRFVTPTETGFAVRDVAGERAYELDDMVCVRVDRTDNYQAGVLSTRTQSCEAWIETGAGTIRIPMKTTVSAALRDPLGEFSERLVQCLESRFRDSLAKGQTVQGEGWELSSEQLDVFEPWPQKTVALDDVAAYGVYDGHLCLWEVGHDEPSLRLKTTAANVPVLARLLPDLVTAKADDASPGGLGRLLWERVPTAGARMGVWLFLVTGVCMVVGVALAATFVRDPIALIAGGGAALLVFFLCWLACATQCTTFCCHVRGIRRRGLFSEQSIAFADVEQLTHVAQDVYVKGQYVGTQYTLTLAGKGRTVKYQRTLKTPDDELTSLVSRVSLLMSVAWRERLLLGEAVVWTPQLKFLPGGLECTPRGFFGNWPTAVVPYSELHDATIDKGKCSVWAVDRKKPIVVEKTATVNFYPGFHLFGSVLNDPLPQAALAAEDSHP